MSFRLVSLLLIVLPLGGCGAPSFLVTPVSSSTTLEEETVQGGGWFAKKVAIIEVEGMLMNAKAGGILQPKENDVSLFAQELDRAAADPRVVAVVLRVNSPGGTVSASDAMYQTLLRFRKKTNKPVVASAQDVAASGAYYVSCAADKIMVQPTSVVGSIGVIFESFDISGTLAKIGARSEAIKSGPLKDMGSPFRPMVEADRQVMQGMIDEYFHRFQSVVTAGRTLEGTRLAGVSDGRVFTGEQAVGLGLADRTGMLVDAIDWAKELAHAPEAKAVIYHRPYGYGGSIYAQGAVPSPQANVFQFNLAPSEALLPTGFYYIWQP